MPLPISIDWSGAAPRSMPTWRNAADTAITRVACRSAQVMRRRKGSKRRSRSSLPRRVTTNGSRLHFASR
jgi:hypothetical protein